jgi:hypothetical protein
MVGDFNQQFAERVTRLIGGGARVWTDSGRLRYVGPEGLLTPDDERFFAEHRDEAVAALSSSGLAVKWPGGACCYCGSRSPATAKPDARLDADGNPDPRFSDLWEGRCTCGAIFSQSNLTGLIVSELVN